MKQKFASFKNNGFTVVEILIVITVLGILATIVYTNIYNSQERAYQTRTNVEFQTIVNALKLYVTKNNNYPPDANRDVPPGIQEFIAPNASVDQWPDAPWPGSVYDYDAWDLMEADGTPGTDGVTDTYQISVRFCPAGGPLSACKFPKEPWAANFGVNSAYYYCLKGNCRSHSSEAATYPGYCVNCPNHTGIGA